MEFQGFQNIIPAGIVLILIVGILALSWASYRKFDSIPLLGKWTMITLRATSLLILLVLLLNPYFYSSQNIEKNPRLAVFLDNSESVAINKGDYKGLSSYNEMLQQLGLNSRNDVQIEGYSMGENVEPINSLEPEAIESQTNLSDPIQSILEMEEDVQAAILITDGIITYGRNPSVSAFNSSIPLFTIALGDTTKVKDVSVSNIITNTTGYTNTRHIVDAEITQSGFQGNTVQVSLKSGDTVIQQKEIRFQATDQVQQVRFELELTEAGLKQYEITVNPLPEEWTTENNQASFNVDILDSKVRILHVAFQVHPDVKAVRRVLESDESTELTTLTWLGGERFIEEIPRELDYNLVILHGNPPNGYDFNFLEKAKETPVILFELQANQFSNYTATVPYRLIQVMNPNVVTVSMNAELGATEQSIMELPDADLSKTPPLLSTIRTSLNDAGAITLFTIRYDGLETDFPAISILERGNIRRAHIIPWGWYRMLQSTNPLHRNYSQTLISNIVSWTASDPDNRKLRITPAKRIFSTSDTPLLNGSLQNERSEAENEGIIEIQLSSEEGTTRSFNMENTSGGNYRLELPRLSEGRYNFSATARKGNRTIETQDGEFLVANSSSELTNTRRNDELLRSIAANSGGSYFTYDRAEAIWDSLEVKGLLEKQTEQIETYLFPIRSLYWFILVMLLLSSEWLLRKYFSLP